MISNLLHARPPLTSPGSVTPDDHSVHREHRYAVYSRYASLGKSQISHLAESPSRLT
jgi:hypothetical protein